MTSTFFKDKTSNFLFFNNLKFISNPESIKIYKEYIFLGDQGTSHNCTYTIWVAGNINPQFIYNKILNPHQINSRQVDTENSLQLDSNLQGQHRHNLQDTAQDKNDTVLQMEISQDLVGGNKEQQHIGTKGLLQHQGNPSQKQEQITLMQYYKLQTNSAINKIQFEKERYRQNKALINIQDTKNEEEDQIHKTCCRQIKKLIDYSDSLKPTSQLTKDQILYLTTILRTILYNLKDQRDFSSNKEELFIRQQHYMFRYKDNKGQSNELINGFSKKIKIRFTLRFNFLIARFLTQTKQYIQKRQRECIEAMQETAYDVLQICLIEQKQANYIFNFVIYIIKELFSENETSACIQNLKTSFAVSVKFLSLYNKIILF